MRNAPLPFPRMEMSEAACREAPVQNAIIAVLRSTILEDPAGSVHILERLSGDTLDTLPVSTVSGSGSHAERLQGILNTTLNTNADHKVTVYGRHGQMLEPPLTDIDPLFSSKDARVGRLIFYASEVAEAAGSYRRFNSRHRPTPTLGASGNGV